MKSIKKYLYLLGFIMVIMPQFAFAGFTSMFGGNCSDYYCWIEKVWSWALTILVPLSAVVLMIAGVIYTTSAGDTKKIDLSKRLIYGVISGIGLIILARLFLMGIIGLPDGNSGWNV